MGVMATLQYLSPSGNKKARWCQRAFLRDRFLRD